MSKPKWWPKNFANLFWHRTQRKKVNECWPWMGMKDGHGYGQFSLGKRHRIISAHRFSWMLANGPIPKNLWVLHRCDNRICVNPNHLFTGTATDNTQDCIKKGRMIRAKGMATGSSKLSDAQIIKIRTRYKAWSRINGTRALGREFGVDHSVISEIINMKKWRHIS